MFDVCHEIMTNPIYSDLFNVKIKSTGRKMNIPQGFDELMFNSVSWLLSNFHTEPDPEDEEFNRMFDFDDVIRQQNHKVSQYVCNYLYDLDKENMDLNILTFEILCVNAFENINKLFEKLGVNDDSIYWEQDCDIFCTVQTRKYIILIDCSNDIFDKQLFTDFACESYINKMEGKFPTQSQIILFNPITNSYVKKSMKTIAKTLAPLFDDDKTTKNEMSLK